MKDPSTDSGEAICAFAGEKPAEYPLPPGEGGEAGTEIADRLFEAIRGFQTLKKRFSPRDPHLRPSERYLLMTLAHQSPEEGMKSSALSALHQVSPAAGTQLVDALVEAGFVERVRDPLDRRSVFVRLTEAGKAYHREAQARMRTAIGGLAEYLGEGDSRELLRLLERIAAYHAASHEPAAKEGTETHA